MSVLSLPKRLAAAVAVLGLSGAGTAGAVTGTALQPDQQPDFARVIVRFKAQADAVKARPLAVRATASEAKDIAQVRGTTLGMRHAATLHARRSLDSRTHVYTASGMSSAELAKRLATDGDVESVEIDRWQKHFSVPNDPLYATAASAGVTAGQWYLKAPDATVLSSINAPAAWDKSTGTGVVVAVLDTGARMDHPDQAGQFVQGYDMIGFGNSGTSVIATANDGDGADSDPSDPGDWVDQSDIDSGRLGSSCTADDIGSSPGTARACSGLIAAIANNGQGMAGLAYNAKILPVRVLGKCGGWASDIAAGMRWAAGVTVPGLPTNSNPAKVINMSLGGDGACSSTYQDAINAAVGVGGDGRRGRRQRRRERRPDQGRRRRRRHAGQLQQRHRGGGPAPCGDQGRLLQPGPADHHQCAGRQLRQHDCACLYPILSTSNSGTTTRRSRPATPSTTPAPARASPHRWSAARSR